MPDQVPEVFAVFQCAICQGNDPVWTSSNRSDHAFGSPGRLMCTGCGTAFKVRNGFLDLHPGDPEPIPPIQHLMQFPPIVAVYEALWRPIGYFIASKHSFPKDVDRIASLIQRKHGLILDLACGPGTFTRRIARLARNPLLSVSICRHKCWNAPCVLLAKSASEMFITSVGARCRFPSKRDRLMP